MTAQFYDYKKDPNARLDLDLKWDEESDSFVDQWEFAPSIVDGDETRKPTSMGLEAAGFALFLFAIWAAILLIGHI